MAFDEALAERVRKALGGNFKLAEKRMFGGLAFLLDGNMCHGIIGADLIARLGPSRAEQALAEPHTKVFDMSGRPMKGWVVVTASGLVDDQALKRWVGACVDHTRTLPPK